MQELIVQTIVLMPSVAKRQQQAVLVVVLKLLSLLDRPLPELAMWQEYNAFQFQLFKGNRSMKQALQSISRLDA